jgi:hypothetical protein
MKKLFIGIVALGLSPLTFNCVAYAPATLLAPAFNPSVYVGIQPGYGLTNWGDGIKNHNGFAGRVYAGYDFHPNFAVEFGFTNWFTKPKAKDEYANIKASGYPWALDLVGKIKAPVPGVNNLGLYAKAGVGYLNSELKGTILNQDYKWGGSAVNVVYGVGATYDITQNIATGLSWARYNGRIHDKKATDFRDKTISYHDLFALDLCYKFFF